MDMPNLKGPLSPEGVDFSNETQAFNFLMEILNDNLLKIEGNAYARRFWYGVAAAVAFAGVLNVIQRLLLSSRLRDAATNVQNPARPASVLVKWFATATAIVREISYWQLNSWKRIAWIKIPPTGSIIILLGYLLFTLGLEFIDNNVRGAQHWEALGIRAGWLAIAQLPLIVLLVNKNNILTYICGVSYERLNVLHRWSARMLLLMATLHFAYQSYNWQKYGLTWLEWTTDTCPPTGIAAYAILLWTNISTLRPLRTKSYEIFVVQHILSFFGFIIAIMFHLPTWALPSRVYVYIPVGLYIIDRLIRTARLVWNNVHLSRATLTALEGDVTLVRLSNRAIKKWKPGAHVLLSIPRFGVFQTHPATILSTPDSHGGDLVFLLKSRRGLTRRIHDGAKSATSPSSSPDGQQSIVKYATLLDGPYGGWHYDLLKFDSVLLLSGGTGVAFTLAALQHIAHRLGSERNCLPLRRLRFIWCVKDAAWTKWVDRELSAAYDKIMQAGVDVQVSVHVTNGTSNLMSLRSKDTEADASYTEEKTTAMTTLQQVASSTAGSDVHVPTGSCLDLSFFHSGRPCIRDGVENLLIGADGESAVAVCGPESMNIAARQAVVSLSDERAIHKGTGAQGVYLHVEPAA